MGKFISRTITIGVVLCGICFVTCNFYDAKNIEDTQTNKINQNNNMLSMMLETDSGSGQYEMTSLSSWPTNGYVFNEQMSKCEQGSILKWDDTNKKVIMEGNVSDKCYVFFDKYNPIKINSYTITPNGNKISISISATSGTGTITKYLYSKDNGVSYVQSANNTYTFTGLDKGTYNIKAYVQDSNGKNSEIIYKTIEITSITLADYVKSLYTGTQGANNIYHHTSTLTNGAGDNSYRYAGASDQVNNYVCFGSTQSPCPADNLYRIIGVFGDRVKLIKSDYATTALLGTDGDYSKMYTAEYQDNSNYKENNLANIAAYTWNYKNNTTINSRYGSNTWSTSLLNKINLNTNYLNNIGSKWANMIDTVVWKVGGNTEANIKDVLPATTYLNEITNPVITNTTDNATTYSAKIGLMYVSDYGFAADQSAWTTKLSSYNSNTSKNWLYLGSEEWTISRYSGYAFYAFRVYSGYAVYIDVIYSHAARPSFNLESSVKYVSGSGSMSDPVRIN